MSIDRELLESLNEGDLVTAFGWQGLCVSGPVGTNSDGSRWMGGYLRLTYSNGQDLPSWTQDEGAYLTVNQRKPEPLYVNHARSDPAERDVVRAKDGNGDMQTWICIRPAGVGGRRPATFVKPERHGWSHALPNGHPESRMCKPFTLLVDGETGQVVP